ncbi:dihydrodipicolinate synthase family protein [Candidatus Entotheonella palauensis]|uniref:dihydrodipicolinate synthase family protein n=1 Tax=Candidatus Entotheonella palauensis TaxID=93172 RepID=UPI000B7FA904|nr:dihydrodipicolinate synthase family protein [Candidatus Entotheonella palauensis]
MGTRRSVSNGTILQGVITLLFTPFSADGKTFDPPSMRRQLDFVLEADVSAIVACGKAGEFEGLTLAEAEQVLTMVLDHVGGRVPVGMGIISVEQTQGLQAADMAARCGADFAMVKKFSKDDVRGFFLNMAERIPVMLYDQTNEGNLDVATHILPLLKECEQIVAAKVSGNVYSFAQLKEATPDVPLICGWDTFSLLGYLSGSDGVVAGSAAFMPEREVALHRLAQAGQWEKARQLFYERMLPMIAFATPEPYAFSVSKYLLYWKGLIDSPIVRPPYQNTPDWMQTEMRALARQLNLIDG